MKKVRKVIGAGFAAVLCIVLIGFAGINLSLIVQDKVLDQEASLFGYVPMIAGESLPGTDFEQGDIIFGIKGEPGHFADWKIAGGGAVYEVLRSPWFVMSVGLAVAISLLIGDMGKKGIYAAREALAE